MHTLLSLFFPILVYFAILPPISSFSFPFFLFLLYFLPFHIFRPKWNRLEIQCLTFKRNSTSLTVIRILSKDPNSFRYGSITLESNISVDYCGDHLRTILKTPEVCPGAAVDRLHNIMFSQKRKTADLVSEFWGQFSFCTCQCPRQTKLYWLHLHGGSLEFS